MEIHQKTVNWCKLRGSRSKGLQFYHTRASFYNILIAMCIEKVVVMKSREELYSITLQSLFENAKSSTEAELIMNARTLQAPTRESHSIILSSTVERTSRGEIETRIQGLSDSSVQEHDHIRKQAIHKLNNQLASPE